MSTEHAHRHGPAHAAHRADDSKRLAVVLALSAAYMVAEVVGGLASNSLALLADAGHMLSDVAALGLSLFAFWIARRPATSRSSYGFYRAEILAALANGAALIAVSIYVFVEAVSRLRNPPAVLGATAAAVALGGLAVNVVGMLVLRHGAGDNLNMKGARLHVATDALGSVGALAAGLAVWRLGWMWADAAASLLIGALVVFSAWSLLRETVSILMESAPAHVDLDAVRDALAEIPGVMAVHDLHCWSITTGLVALSCHVCIADATRHAESLAVIRAKLHDRFGIDHTTIQIEPEGFAEGAIHD
jgi:cobalt-zinc-cadmium efflux system protein